MLANNRTNLLYNFNIPRGKNKQVIKIPIWVKPKVNIRINPNSQKTQGSINGPDLHVFFLKQSF